MRELDNIGKKVRKLRRSYGMSVKGLSRLSGVSTRTIRRVEDLDNPEGYLYVPKIDTVHNLAKSFGLTTGDFLSSNVKSVFDVSSGIRA